MNAVTMASTSSRFSTRAGAGGEAHILAQRVAAQHRGHAAPHLVAGARDRDPAAVAALEVTVRADIAGHQTEPGTDEAGGGEERRHLVEHPEDRFVECDVDHLSAGFLAAAQRHQRADGAVEAGDVVGERGGARG